MKKYFIIIAIAALVIGGYFMIKPAPKAPTDAQATYSNNELGFEFDYPTGPQGYVLEEPATSGPKDDLVKTIVLTPAEAKQAGAPAAGEGPATITINVFANTKKQQPSVWLLGHKNYSGVQKEEPAEYVLGGANAVRYPADGLYASDNVVAAHAGYIYLLVGNYADSQSKIKKDFQPLLDSVRFIPVTEAVSAKINIDAVCTGALAYMTFADNKSADAFIAECKEGKHQEVIEKYKKDAGLGEGAAI